MKKITLKKHWLLVLFLFVFNLIVYSQPSGWTHYQLFNVTEHSGALITNYQLKLTVNTQVLISGGQMDITGKDIRFGKTLSGATLFNYWIESGINTANTIIWVKIDSLPANSTRPLYWFYGNPSATAVSAVTGTFFGPNSANDSVVVGSTNTVSTCQRGFRFTPTQDLLATDFGKSTPNATARFVTLFNYTTTAKVAQVTTPTGTPGQYVYNPISRPIWLSKDSTYVLEVYNAGGDMYYYGTSSQIGQYLTYGDMRYCNSCDQNTFPTSSLSGYHYGIPDLLYWSKREVNPPPTYINVTSIKDYASNTSTVVYPNPTTGIINFILSQGVQVFVYNQLGEMILYKEIKDGNQNIDISNFSNGIYMMRLINGDKQDVVKITKM